MYDLYPYFTNDGSVGLFSQQDDDIYHSTYGALTESWQKFILPSHLQEFLAQNNSVKILDICYGIGYNTKTALNVFVKKVLKDKNYNKKNIKFKKIVKATSPSIAAIDTDNILSQKTEQKLSNYEKCITSYTNTIEAIDTDNILQLDNNINEPNSAKLTYKSIVDEHDLPTNFENSILIDAIDIDKTLIGLSPFVRITTPTFALLKNKLKHNPDQNKFAQIKKIQDAKISKPKKEFMIRKEVPLILFLKLLEQKFQFNDKILQTILTRKKYTPFLSRFMLNFAKFYSNQGYNNVKKKINLTFLHNIYYRYVSKSYKNVEKLVKNNKVDINFHNDDARCFIKSSNQTYDFIFLDAFTPSKCPALWTIEFMNELYSRLEDNGMVLTYSNSAAIRNAFLKAGFKVGKIYDKSLRKFVGTVAAKNTSLIEHELDDHDLGLVNSKAGICFRDPNLNLDNSIIISNRMIEAENSGLISSSQFLKGQKH